MSPAVPTVPKGYHSITVYLYVHDAAAAIEFYTRAFGGKEMFRMPAGPGKIGHAEMLIGDSHVMLADEVPEMGVRSPKAIGGSAMSLLLYVDDVDAVVARAVAAGATLTRPVEDKFYGDRAGMVTDPFGHAWSVATHKEDVSMEEMKRRMASMAK
jgi:PhnB protein